MSSLRGTSLAVSGSRVVMPLQGRSVFHLGKATFSKMGQKSLFQQAEKTTALAIEKKIVGSVLDNSAKKTFEYNYTKSAG